MFGDIHFRLGFVDKCFREIRRLLWDHWNRRSAKTKLDDVEHAAAILEGLQATPKDLAKLRDLVFMALKAERQVRSDDHQFPDDIGVIAIRCWCGHSMSIVLIKSRF
jgi:hypothetical protein